MKIPSKVFDPLSTDEYRYAHYKRDGHFTRVIRHYQTGALLFSSSGMANITAKVMAVTHLQRQFAYMPKGATVLCELWQPGKVASDVKTLLNHRSAELRCDVFAVETSPNAPDGLGYKSYPGGLNNEALQTIEAICQQWRVPFIEWVTLQGDAHRNQLMQEIASGAKKDVEGLVFKNGNLLDWCKWKPRKTIDLVIAGFQPGEGKYAGQVGSIECYTAEAFHVADCSGMTDQQRQYISQNTDSLIGKVIEVEYQSVGNRGRLRHPAFVRLRDDKQDWECGTNQDADLQRYWSAAAGPLFGDKQNG